MGKKRRNYDFMMKLGSTKESESPRVKVRAHDGNLD